MELWQTAIDLIGPYSVNEVSRVLKLNHTEVKKRYEAQAAPAKIDAPPPDSRFVEFAWDAPMGRVSDCVLEVEGREGRKLKLTVRDEGAGLDVLALAKGLWEATT